MADPIERRRPDFKYLVAAGLLGFVLGAFVVASLGNMGGAKATVATATSTAVTASPPLAPLAEPAKLPPATAVDEPPNAVVEVPAPTSGRTGMIPVLRPPKPWKLTGAKTHPSPAAGNSPRNKLGGAVTTTPGKGPGPQTKSNP